MIREAPFIQGAVEGPVDRAVLTRLLNLAGGTPDTIHVTEGKSRLLANLRSYNYAGAHAPWVVLVDLDGDFDCAPAALAAWLPAPAPLMRLRVAVRSVEAWLLADVDRIASFLSVARTRVPPNPDTLDHPKRALVDLARRSRRAAIKADLVPTVRGGRQVGPGYTGRVLEFVGSNDGGWDPSAAALNSPSLARALAAVQALVAGIADPGLGLDRVPGSTR